VQIFLKTYDTYAFIAYYVVGLTELQYSQLATEVCRNDSMSHTWPEESVLCTS